MGACLDCRLFDDEPASTPPHPLMTRRSRIGPEGLSRDFLCTDCGRIWDRTANGWRRQEGPRPRHDPIPPIEPFG